jgi:chemotaxis protein CheD
MTKYAFGGAQQTASMPEQPLTQGKTHILGIAEYKITHAPDKLATLGLGSCVGAVLYDSVHRVAGMVHIMMPTAPQNTTEFNHSKFADTAIDELIRLMIGAGALPRRLVAKIAGGAHMFNAMYNSDIMNVGDRNVLVCKQQLKRHAIPLVAEDTGGACGRSIEFCCVTGLLQVRTVSPKNIRML